MANRTDKETERKAAEFDLELLIARVLRIGVFSSAALLGFGLIFYLIQDAAQAGDWHTSINDVAQNSRLYKLAVLLPALFRLEPLAFVEAGVILLILTPIIRVAASVFLFARERDKLYVAITLIVLATLLVGWFI